MIALPDGSIAKVSVYKNGDTVTVVGMAKHETPAGVSETIIQSRMTVSTFEWYQDRASRLLSNARGTLAYQKLLGMAGVTDSDVQNAMRFNVRAAPALPQTNMPRLKR